MQELHDMGYRLIFSYPEMVEDLLRHFVGGAWIDELDFSTLEKVSERDLSPQLVRREKDLLWRLRWHPPTSTSGEWLYLFIHLEFQSTVDRFMALREVTYKMLLYENLLRTDALTKTGKLPPVLAITVYNGEAAWEAAVSLEDLVEPLPNKSTAESILSYTLIDERSYSLETLTRQQGLSSILFQLEKSEGFEGMRQGVERALENLQGEKHRSLRRAFATWLAQVLIPARLPREALELPEVRDLMEIKTMLEQKVIKWTEEWKQEGREEGREEGELKGRCEILERQLELKFGPLPRSTRERLTTATSAQLLDWATRVLTADSIDDVFEK